VNTRFAALSGSWASYCLILGLIAWTSPASAQRAPIIFGRCDTLRLRVDDQGFTRIDEAKGLPVTVCFEPKRDAFMRYYLEGLTR